MMRVQSKPENNGCKIAHAAIFFYSDTCARKMGVSGCLWMMKGFGLTAISNIW